MQLCRSSLNQWRRTGVTVLLELIGGRSPLSTCDTPLQSVPGRRMALPASNRLHDGCTDITGSLEAVARLMTDPFTLSDGPWEDYTQLAPQACGTERMYSRELATDQAS